MVVLVCRRNEGGRNLHSPSYRSIDINVGFINDKCGRVTSRVNFYTFSTSMQLHCYRGTMQLRDNICSEKTSIINPDLRKCRYNQACQRPPLP